MRYEYKVIPAPARGEKAKGVKTPVDRFSLTLTMELNRMGSEGWEYVRAETLPSEERSGLTGRNTVYNNVLVFRRLQARYAEPVKTRTSTSPQPEYPVEAILPPKETAPKTFAAQPPAISKTPKPEASDSSTTETELPEKKS